MVDRADEIVEGMREMRIRQAILTTALLRLGGSLVVTARDAYDAAAHNIEVRRTGSGFVASLRPAPR